MKSVLVIEEVTREQMGEPPRSHAKTLKEWREYYKVNETILHGPDGAAYEVDLRKWDDAPEDTLIVIYSWWRDPDLIGTKDPQGKPW